MLSAPPTPEFSQPPRTPEFSQPPPTLEFSQHHLHPRISWTPPAPACSVLSAPCTVPSGAHCRGATLGAHSRGRVRSFRQEGCSAEASSTRGAGRQQGAGSLGPLSGQGTGGEKKKEKKGACTSGGLVMILAHSAAIFFCPALISSSAFAIASISSACSNANV